jgi:hypothetical protein
VQPVVEIAGRLGLLLALNLFLLVLPLRHLTRQIFRAFSGDLHRSTL